MPKRRRGNRSDNEVETATFSIPEDDTLSSTPAASTTATLTTFSPPLPEQVFNVSEWTVETDRVSTSNTLFSSMVEPAPSMSFSESDHLHPIPGAYHDYYDVVNVSDFQPPPGPVQHSQSSNTERSKSSKARLFFSFSLIVTI
jgi:hypothetical protein